MNARRRYVLVTALSLGLVALLLLFVSLEEPIENRAQGRLVLRDAQVAVPPPPTPPPPAERITEREVPDVNIRNDAAASAPSLLADLELDVDMPAAALPAHGIGDGVGGGAGGLGVQWDGFGLPYLDSTPVVLSAPLIEFPAPLLERGIRSIDIEVMIQIDEEGNTTLLQIVSTTYRPFNEDLRDFVSAVRFSPPTVGGEAVKAVYAWPLRINARDDE